MKLEFDLVEREFTTQENRNIKYYVLVRKLIDGSVLEIPIKGDKSRVLLMSLALEKNK